MRRHARRGAKAGKAASAAKTPTASGAVVIMHGRQDHMGVTAFQEALQMSAVQPAEIDSGGDAVVCCIIESHALQSDEGRGTGARGDT